ncbi:hypothetical protein [Candidatus Palauibacter polyketidifaciens]|uniref:hypothetical protein n=1 Tax=Candidatus Palauibacter polyketidifaciens TaxID=3056740 RepID=UPI0023855C33|nr:hypothetical protein [Candidatus Palauibacter polyketidifaciens]MDE2719536.1 hypothetical protein [Candidatus Palauibacter polyketidifaciens]
MKILSYLWKTIGPRRVGLVVMCVYTAWLVFFYRYHWVDGINLLNHEVGRVVFSPLARLSAGGETLAVLAGPLLQLAVPLYITYRLWRRGEATPAAVSALWSAESLMYAAESMAGAHRLALPVIGDHSNNWRLLLDRIGALESAEQIGLALHLLASAAAVAAVWWAIRLENFRTSE